VGLILFGRIAQAILGLVALRVMTSMLSPEDVGRWSLMLAITSFFVFGLVNPVGMFINRRLHVWVEHGRSQQYLMYYIIYLLLISVLAGGLIYGVIFFYDFVPGMSTTWILGLVMGAIVFSTLNQTFIPSLNLLGYRGWFVILTLGSVSLALLMSVGFSYWWGGTAQMWLAGQLSGQFFFAVIGGGIFFHYVRLQRKEVVAPEVLSLNYKKVWGLFSFSWPLTIAVLLTWVQSQSYRFVTQDLIGLDELGLFVMGYGLSASLLGLAESVLSSYFIPNFYKRVSNSSDAEKARAWFNYARAVMPTVLIMMAFVLSTSDELTHILLDEKFGHAAQYVLWGVLAEATRVIVGVYALLAHAAMNTKKLMFPNILGAVSSPVLMLLLVPIWGVDGVGLGLVIAGFFASVSSHYFLSKSYKVIMPWKRLSVGLMMAVSIFGLAELGHLFLGASSGLINAIIWLVCIGVVTIGVLYMLIKEEVQSSEAV